MCGRYVSTRRPQDLAQLFHADEWPATEALAPNWNVAPTNDVWAVLERTPRDDDGAAPARELRPLRWGLVPSWAKEPKIGARMINARVETVHEKPVFRRAFVKRRCLLPADGFYEWQPGTDPATGKARKQPYFIHPEDDQVMALAGLYEYWRDPAVSQDDDPAAWLMTCTITERGWSNGTARGEDWSDGYTETVLLDDPARGEKWALLSPLALWTDVMVEAERLGFDLDEQRAEASEG
ncbi:SOS response-associated peptidase [Streptomyces sp. NPDC053086]|uniref:SOS response-associated peptidase n=1 Tax=unclassified Streptomyces TaxID=2593676 RepID=UPI0037CF9453